MVFLRDGECFFFPIAEGDGKETENDWETTGKQTNGEETNFSRIVSGDKVRQAEGKGSSAAWIANAFALPKCK